MGGGKTSEVFSLRITKEKGVSFAEKGDINA